MKTARTVNCILTAFFVCFFVACGGGGAESGSGVIKAWVPDEVDVLLYSEKAVRNSLKFPDDATFPWFSQSIVHLEEYNRFRVTGKVKAKNLFGAELTHNYAVVIEYDSDGKSLELILLQLGGEILYYNKSHTKNPEAKPEKSNHQKQRDEHAKRKRKPPVKKAKSRSLTPEEKERAARKLMEFADAMIEKKTPQRAVKWLKRILERYPQTEAAKEAKSKLQDIGELPNAK